MSGGTATESMIAMHGVNKWFDKFHVLKDIDLSVRKGERVVVCGPSGSGKSTLIRCINRLETSTTKGEPSSWTASNSTGGHENRGRSARGRNGVPEFNLFPHLSALEN